MKLIVHICLLLLPLLLFNSCDQFLEEDPDSFITPDDFFTDERDGQAAIDAIYSHLSNTGFYANEYILIGTLFSDIGISNSGDPHLNELSDFSLQAGNVVVESTWKKLYAALNTANFAIENIHRVPISEPEQLELIAEGRFFRALFYFDLVRYFGDVPLILESFTEIGQNYSVSRAPADSVYTQILEDFDFARNNLPTSSQPWRPTQSTAIAFMNKVYVAQKDYPRAFQFSRAFIQSGQFSLLNDYADIFKVGNNHNSEIIFAIDFNQGNETNLNERTLPPVLNGKELELPTAGFYASFDSLDRRRTASFITSYMGSDLFIHNFPPHISKYWDRDVEPAGGKTINDLPILRYSEILLNHAEAVNELNNGPTAEAYVAINTVRARARFDGLTSQNVLPDLSGLNKEQFREAILLERSKELGWEGHRWFDLVRFDELINQVNISKASVPVTQKHHLLPIPAYELQLNPALGPQNPGY
jgi:hypothetical protein